MECVSVTSCSGGYTALFPQASLPACGVMPQNPSTGEEEAGGSGVKVSLGSTERCLGVVLYT